MCACSARVPTVKRPVWPSPTGRQHVDNNLLVDHVAEACTSDMLFKYVLDGESRAAFAGKVMVRPGAQQTLSHQNSANLCISPTAHVHSLPMLEIYADDVRCNHGSTIGKLDESALLYLRQRGIPLAERACSCNMPLWPKCCSVCRVKRCAIGSPTSWNAVFAANSATVPTVVKNVP